MPAFWRLLAEGRSAIGTVPSDRWSLTRFHDANPRAAGKSYSWAAGVLDDIWGFDPGVFGISPREAEQIDPQQRLALQVAWEAIEDAGIRAGDLAGGRVGVYVGASSTDYGNLRLFDEGGGDGHMATGTTLSIVANRLSYVYDFKGPSFTVDTACSSSLVALAQARAALAAGEIDTAIVAGVNVLASPFPFISFSRASMLSASGRCHSFAAAADGYVRSEGCVALVLRRADTARANADAVCGVIAAAGVNSDGRTVGLSLPSSEAQAALLGEVWSGVGADPDSIAFVEAHGTGTRVGDPAEAAALGMALARRRGAPLPIGSVKSNLGHLEPAAGLVGLLKAVLALENDLLPASLNFDEPNPDIAFADLNIAVAGGALPLARGSRPRYAGVNSFGFGGTNAHVVVRDPDTAPGPQAPCAGAKESGEGRLLMLSAESRESLRALAAAYRERLAEADGRELARIAAASGHSREVMAHRLVLPADSAPSARRALEAFARGEEAGIVSGTAPARAAPVAFVYSGNASQWAGMGRRAYESDPAFATRLDAFSAAFAELAGWSVREALFADDLEARLERAETAQPLLFAVQTALTAALRARGLAPAVTLGHSVGEIAAAEAAGVLGPHEAARVIFARSVEQEAVFEAGTMASALTGEDEARRLIGELGLADLTIAGINSPRALSFSGSRASIEALASHCRRARVAMKTLDLRYPFHSALIEPIRAPLMERLKGLRPRAGDIAFVSTVSGEAMDGARADAEHWWRNVRDVVRFADAVRAAAALGARVFVEIGPQPILQKFMSDTLAAAGMDAPVLPSFDRAAKVDPVGDVLARAVAAGARVDPDAAFGQRPARRVRLPLYPWNNREFRIQKTVESLDIPGRGPEHPLLGHRLRAEDPVWYGHVSLTASPDLADHAVNGQAVIPGAAFLDAALTAGRAFLETDQVELRDFDVLQPLVLKPDGAHQTRVEIARDTMAVDIWSRPRFSEGGWLRHATGRLARVPSARPPRAPAPSSPRAPVDAQALYAEARAAGLDYGPVFRNVDAAWRESETELRARLRADAPARAVHALDPAAFDACFHGLIALFGEHDGRHGRVTYLPVRFGRLRLHRPGAQIAQAAITVRHASERSILADFTALDAEGEVIAELREARFKGVVLRPRARLEHNAYVWAPRPAPRARTHAPRTGAKASAHALRGRLLASGILGEEAAEREESGLLIDVAARSATLEALRDLTGRGGVLAAPRLAQAAPEPELRRQVAALLGRLEETGLAEPRGADWKLAAPRELPGRDALLRAITVDAPGRLAEVEMINEAARRLRARLAADGTDAPARAAGAPAYSAPLVDHFETAAPDAERMADALAGAAEAWIAARPAPAPRVLVTGMRAGDGLRRVAAAVQAHGGSLAVHDDDRRALEALKRTFAHAPGIRFKDELAASDGERFDAVVALGALAVGSAPERLAGLLDADGMLLAGEYGPCAFLDFVFGHQPTWFEDGLADEFPLGAARGGADWADALSRAGFAGPVHAPVAGTGLPASLILADAPKAASAQGAEAGQAPTAQSELHPVLVAALAPAADFAGDLQARLRMAGRPARLLVLEPGAPADPERLAAKGEVVFVHAGARDGHDEASDPSARLTHAMAAFRDLCLAQPADTRVWTVSEAALAEGAAPAPEDRAFLAFTRVAANEFAQFDLRHVDLDISAPDAAELLARHLCAPTREREVRLGRDGAPSVHRLARGLAGPAVPLGDDTRAVLALGPTASLDDVAWRREPRRRPGEHEIEIAVEASGVNFRDIMWAMGVLSDEALEDGFAGPTLGLECGGRVVRAGPGVSHLKEGDAVVAFAPGSFASHVTVDASVAAPLPAGMSTAEAATLPVAFLTVYYALHHLARLKRGETVLIHGGAGGVGIAAIQVAKWRGARILTTAGTPEKRHFLEMLGADHVLDSRSLEFVDAVREIAPDGVDVVLNALSGEAMERSLGLVRPFGRFLELGKRDYYANTRIGLRPFRQNLSYFGIDADQLLVREPALGRRMFRDMLKLFEKGVLSPLPYRAFSGEDAVSAFRLMQQSGHIGKIVVAPPARLPAALPEAAAFRARGEGVHVVVGGFGGFGLALAEWLADRGARHLALIGRSGMPESAREAVGALRARGVAVHAIACDAADGQALARTLDALEAEAGPIAGMVHAAMVLDDGLLQTLSPERMERVLRPKVEAARHLDAAARARAGAGAAPDYFVLFSSATTVIGNPGQANYVAANAYLEALAEARRADGLPALAIGWGAIEDAGYLARNAEIGNQLSQRAGAHGLRVGEALEHLGTLLALGPSAPASLAVAPIDWQTAGQHLKIVSGPAFEEIMGGVAVRESAREDRVDLKALIAGKSPEAAREAVTGLIAGEVARVLRLPADDVNPHRPLAEIGMDSLMGLELGLAIQTRFDVDMPAMSVAEGITLQDVAASLVARVGAGAGAETSADTASEQLIRQHIGEGENAEDLAPLADEVRSRSATMTRTVS